MQTILHSLSFNKAVGFVSGLIVCAITNSLSLVAVLLVNFVSGELLQMESCIPILLGAAVGSTFISYLVVFQVTAATEFVNAFSLNASDPVTWLDRHICVLVVDQPIILSVEVAERCTSGRLRSTVCFSSSEATSSTSPPAPTRWCPRTHCSAGRVPMDRLLQKHFTPTPLV